MEDNRRYLEGIREELYKIHNGEIADEDGNTYTFWDYIADNVLDLNYIINADKTYRAVELCIGYGGPNVYINTRSQEIELYWGTDHESVWLPSEICEELYEIYNEFYTE